MAAQAIDNVFEAGNILQVAEALSAMENFTKEIKDNDRFKDYVREEAGKSPKGFISNSGAKIELAEVGTRYDYSNCNDPEWFELKTKKDCAEMILDRREKFLKTVPLSGLDIISYDGEGIKVYPPSKTSTSSYKITLAR